MKHLLLLDSKSNFEADVKHALADYSLEDVFIETVKSVSEVLKKSVFWKNNRLGSGQDNFDIFVICISKTDLDYWNFVQYVLRNKPQLPILIISFPDCSWLIKHFISKTQKRPMHAETKQELIDKIGILLSDCSGDQKPLIPTLIEVQ